MTSWRMQPTAVSALGVIAIVSVMITLTASESESGTLEQGTRRVLVRRGEFRSPTKEDTPETNSGNSSVNAAIILSSKNDTSSEAEPAREDVHEDTDRLDSMNLTNSETDGQIAELQRDQSDDRVVSEHRMSPESKSAPPESMDKTERQKKVEKAEEEEEEEGASGGTKAKETAMSTEAYVEVVGGSPTSGVAFREDARGVQAAVASRKKSGQLDAVQGEIEGLSLSISRQEEPANSSPSDEATGNLSGDSGGHSSEQTITLATELRSLEQKNVEDIKAISFQVPGQVAPPASTHEGQPMKQNEDSSPQAKSDTKKEQSRGLNNILLSGKSTKAFYEIKPSIKTEMEGQERQVTLSSQVNHHRKFVLPSVDSAIGKYGPYFEDGDQEMNITARIGSTVLLDCKIGMLGDKKVTWLQHSKDSFRLLTVGRTPYSNDQRISLNFRYPSNWRLQILFASPRDSGLYKCQVATHPPLIKEINVIVTAPELTITDDSGRLVSKERHLKAGSALKLRCQARDVLESLEESVIWTRGDETLTEDVSENRTTETAGDKEVLVIVSTLTVERATPRHAGNYSCVVPGKAKTSIAIHVLNGELPAAVHDGNGVSRAFLNLWLIHLTMSYVFSR